MSKPLPKEDFRATRFSLEPSDFALGSEFPDPPPRDLISKKTWNDIVSLPDDVAIRTSNDFGGILKDVVEFQSELVCVSLAMQDLQISTGRKKQDSPILYVLLPVSEDLAASIYNATTGYYRAAFSALRNVVENMAIGLHLELSGDHALFQSWVSNGDLMFGPVADTISRCKAIHELEEHLSAATGDNFFRQRKQKSLHDSGGFARRLFGGLSRYTHGRPGYTDGDMRESNGPVFVPKAFIEWAIAFVQAYGFGLIVCRLAQPNLRSLGTWSKNSLEGLFNQATARLRPQDDGTKLFQNLPVKFW